MIKGTAKVVKDPQAPQVIRPIGGRDTEAEDHWAYDEHARP